MPVLYVENVPRDLYEALRKRARARRRSIAAEVLSLLEETIPNERELGARKAMLRRIEELNAKREPSRRRFPSTEELQREDRGR